ncbi:hypothetical protein JCM19274_5617 [Algibacter lectus]|nr:hypothetical protein JCM19274_5617 [Algibacter lectus]
MTLDVLEKGKYLIDFKNQDSLKVWKSGFPFISRLLTLPIEKQWVQICIV